MLRWLQYDVLRAHERGEAVVGLVKLVHGDSFGEAALLARQLRRCDRIEYSRVAVAWLD